jgi:hypothetical protein
MSPILDPTAGHAVIHKTTVIATLGRPPWRTSWAAHRLQHGVIEMNSTRIVFTAFGLAMVAGSGLALAQSRAIVVEPPSEVAAPPAAPVAPAPVVETGLRPRLLPWSAQLRPSPRRFRQSTHQRLPVSPRWPRSNLARRRSLLRRSRAGRRRHIVSRITLRGPIGLIGSPTGIDGGSPPGGFFTIADDETFEGVSAARGPKRSNRRSVWTTW